MSVWGGRREKGQAMRFAGKTVLIVGAATGLGAEAARAFAGEGARLVLVDRNAAGLAALGRDLVGAALVTGDASLAGTADAAVAAAGRVDVLFGNAGIDPWGATDVPGTTEADWDRVMAVNVTSAFLFARAVLPGMIAAKAGSMVFTASVAGVKPVAGEVAYAVSKAALVQLTRCIALDHARDGIRANALCPGYLEAVMADRRADMTPAALAARKANAAAAVPMGREGSYAEMARLVLFLADPAQSGYVTGQALVADGGVTLV